jgi:hypothetical protein
MTSPIQSRTRIDGVRRIGTAFLWVGVFFIAIWIAFAIWQGFHVLTAIELALGISFLVQGIVRRRAAAKALTNLEDEFGRGTGVQDRS